MAIDIVIPIKNGEDANRTFKSLAKQTYKDFVLIVVNDFEERGANWARNKGFGHVTSEFVLFSDDDINWKPYALEALLGTLESNPEATYSYGSYRIGRDTLCIDEFNPELLKQRNIVSTMSLIRSKDFPGFDESLSMFQDWDLWLTLLAQDKVGVYCGRTIFSTTRRRGRPSPDEETIEQARRTIQNKHNL